MFLKILAQARVRGGKYRRVLGEQHGRIRRSGFHRFRFAAERRRKAGAADRAAIRRQRSDSHHRKAQPRRHVSEAPGAATGRAGIFWREPARIRVRGNVQRGVWAGYAGAGARGLRPAQLYFGAERAGDVSDLHLWLGRAERQMAAAAAIGESHRLFRIDGAAVRFESRRHADARGEKGRRLRAERRKNVDHQRLDRGRGGGVGQMRRRKDSRVSGGEREKRFQDLRCARQMVAARFGDLPGCRSPTAKSRKKICCPR